MKIVGLTGGIGSGKTTVAEMFRDLGIPVYIADTEAKRLTNTSKVIRRKLEGLLGSEAYLNNEINRGFVADKIFNDPSLLHQVNEIIHPKVRAHFKRWAKKQSSPYVIKEAAILFENGGYKECDSTILVTAPKQIRVQRIQNRDHSTLDRIEDRMKNQWEDEKKIPLADFVIENIELSNTKSQVVDIHKNILKNL